MILLLFLNFLIAGSDSLLVKSREVADFSNAVSVTTDGKENIYVLDAGTNQIVKFDNKLNYLKRNGKQGWDEGQFDSPTCIDGSSGLDIFVTDGKNKRVQRLDLELNPISILKTNLPDFTADYQFNTPVATLVLNSRELYVIDGDNNRIVIYKDGRNPSGIFGDYSSGKGQLSRPVKILKDGKNFIYVLDKELKTIFRFDNLGNYINRLTIENLESFTISGNTLYMFNGKEILIYDLERNTVTDTKILPGKISKKKFRDILVLNSKKYLLLEKNTLSLWQEN
ncbi:MAG: NHL repeat-containing protein [Ignavibacteria bacterium]|nr:NHL repeat-containing protein [Ignavibacteria bacterium]MBK7160574.1 NHL repeat-containing protein [Ignavibacteria bacterium]MBK7447510.1 NHL repeat-containing protein [Ignavibacteria bacterium]